MEIDGKCRLTCENADLEWLSGTDVDGLLADSVRTESNPDGLDHVRVLV
jgi:hypothetical protein